MNLNYSKTEYQSLLASNFSVSNHSSQPLFIVKCEVANDGLNGGGGGYSEWFLPYGLEDFDVAGGLELAPDQTEFFSVLHKKELDRYDPRLALKLMGIEIETIASSLAEGPYTARISVRRTRLWPHNPSIVFAQIDGG